jgi:hypothetical protein
LNGVQGVSKLQRAQQEMADFEREYIKTNPDYQTAKDAVINAETRKLVAAGYEPAQAKQKVEMDLLHFADNLVRINVHPVAGLHQYIKSAYTLPEVAKDAPKATLNTQREIKARAKTVSNKGASAASNGKREWTYDDYLDPEVRRSIPLSEQKRLLETHMDNA